MMNMTMQYETAVYIGRFQPFHQGHLACVRHALQLASEVMIIVGSINQPRSERNPWRYNERRRMINAALTDEERKRIIIRGVADYDDDQRWVNEVKALVRQRRNELKPKETYTQGPVALLGYKRDATSFYLDMFDDWYFEEVSEYQDINASRIREQYLQRGDIQSVSRPVADQLRKFIQTPIYKRLVCGVKTAANQSCPYTTMIDRGQHIHSCIGGLQNE